MARRLARRGAEQQPLALAEKAAPAPAPCAAPCDDDSDGAAEPCAHAPGWRKKANLRMYTILDNIF